jgi:hypothetical protein
MVVVDCSVTVALPEAAAFDVVPISVPAPVMLNIIVFDAVVTVLLTTSHTLDVMSEVDMPFAVICEGLAVFSSFTGGVETQSTLTVHSARFADVALTVAVPAVVPAQSVTVATPADAAFAVVPKSVPVPVTEKVSTFAAVVTVLLQLSLTQELISDVSKPSAVMLTGLAEFMSFTGGR